MTEQEDVSLAVKEAKLKENKQTSVLRQGVMVMEWLDKKPVSFTSTFHSNLHKPRGI